MRSARSAWSLLVCITVFLLIACTSTKFSGRWRDEAYEVRPDKILVVNLFPNPATRRIFEDEIVEALQRRRIEAVASYTRLPDATATGTKSFAAHAAEVGADMVLVNGPFGLRTQETVSPSTPYTFEELYLGTRTEVYEAKSDRLVFQVTAETWVRQEVLNARSIRSYVDDLVSELLRSGIVRGAGGSRIGT